MLENRSILQGVVVLTTGTIILRSGEIDNQRCATRVATIRWTSPSLPNDTPFPSLKRTFRRPIPESPGQMSKDGSLQGW